MRIPKYWAKGTCTGRDQKGRDRYFWAWGWSFDSLSAAAADATARARRIFERFARGEKPDTYQYLDHPTREEIVETLGRDSEPTVLVTRNRNGSLVLNSAKVCFVDVDFPRPEPVSLWETLKSLFSGKKKTPQVVPTREETIEKVRQWAARNPQRSFRLYRTAAGLRMLLTDRLYDPISAEVAALFDELGSDALYRKLTLKQECFRARLTPKHWRCNCRRPPNQYPWEKPEEERAYRKWQQEYENKSKAFGTCHLLEAFGASSSDEAIQTIVQFHDRTACCGPEVKLA